MAVARVKEDGVFWAVTETELPPPLCAYPAINLRRV